jgi:hypothetical protein
MCQYLKIQDPEYWTERHSLGELWFARFLTEKPTSKTGHTVIAPTVVRSLNGFQECAKMVENSLFEKIYSHEIHLEDGCAVFRDPVSQNQQDHQSQFHPRKRRLLEKDEGLPLATIAKRYDTPAKLDHLPTSTKAVPLKVAERPIIPASIKELETRRRCEANMYTHAKLQAHADARAPARNQLNVSDIPRHQKARQPAMTPTMAAREGASISSNYPTLTNITAQQSETINKVNKVKQLDERKTTNISRQFLPSGQHRYNSSALFHETTTPHLATEMAPPPPPSAPKPRLETHRDAPDDDEVIYIGQRTIQDVCGSVKGGVELEEGEIW